MEKHQKKGLVGKLLDKSHEFSRYFWEGRGAKIGALGLLYLSLDGTLKCRNEQINELSFLWGIRSFLPWYVVNITKNIARLGWERIGIKSMLLPEQVDELLGNLKKHYQFENEYFVHDEYTASSDFHLQHGAGAYRGAYNLLVCLRDKRFKGRRFNSEKLKPPQEIRFVFRHSPRRKSSISISEEGKLVKLLREEGSDLVPQVFFIGDQKRGSGRFMQRYKCERCGKMKKKIN
jgi:hypothetical protein